jgi:hypothetical protein
MKKLIVILAIVLISCTKTTTNNTSTTSNDSFNIISYKTEWCVCQSYIAKIKYSYSIDTTGVSYIEITNNLRQGQNYSFRHYNPGPTLTTNEVVDLAACNGCSTTYYASIIYRNGTIKHFAEIRL